MAGKLFVFDLDDTLTMNQVLYDRNIVKCWEYLVKLFGAHKVPSLQNFHKMADAIDANLVKSFGFDPARYPTSMAMAYDEIYKRDGLQRCDGKYEREHIYKLASQVFDPANYRKQGLVPGAIDVLKFLKGQGDFIVLFTKGNLNVQREKIKALFKDNAELNGEDFFRMEVIARQSKTPNDFFAIALELFEIHADSFGKPSNQFFSIGNSFKSDIKPALEAGFNGIYIPYETWKYEEENATELERWKERVMILKDITEIKTGYGRL